MECVINIPNYVEYLADTPSGSAAKSQAWTATPSWYTASTINGMAIKPNNMRGSHPFWVGLSERFKGEETQEKGKSWEKKYYFCFQAFFYILAHEPSMNFGTKNFKNNILSWNCFVNLKSLFWSNMCQKCGSYIIEWLFETSHPHQSFCCKILTELIFIWHMFFK